MIKLNDRKHQLHKVFKKQIIPRILSASKSCDIKTRPYETESHSVHNQKENCHCDHIPFNLKVIRYIFLYIYIFISIYIFNISIFIYLIE